MSNSLRKVKHRGMTIRSVDSTKWPFTGNLGSIMRVPFLARLKCLFFGRLELHMGFHMNKMAKIGPAESSVYFSWPIWVERLKMRYIEYLKKNSDPLPPDGGEPNVVPIGLAAAVEKPEDVLMQVGDRKRGKFQVGNAG